MYMWFTVNLLYFIGHFLAYFMDKLNTNKQMFKNTNSLDLVQCFMVKFTNLFVHQYNKYN